MEAIISAAITGFFSLCVCLVTNHFQQEKTRALLEYQLKELSKQVEKHNKVIERTFVLEGQMKECQHDIQHLQEYHKPN